MERPNYLARCSAECTRSVIFLLQRRFRKNSTTWHTESVWLSREEAEQFGKSKTYSYKDGLWRVYGLPAEGELGELIKTT